MAYSSTRKLKNNRVYLSFVLPRTFQIKETGFHFVTFICQQGFPVRKADQFGAFHAYVNVFMSPTDSVLRIAPGIMRIYGLAYLLLPLNIFATYYFQSVMQPKTALIISMARGMVLCGVLVFVLPALFGAKLLWWVMPITEFAVAIYTILCMVKSNRSLKELFLAAGQNFKGGFPFAVPEGKLYRIIVKDLGYCEKENVDKRTVFT